MIHYIKGRLTMFIAGAAVIENSGIGYEVYVPDNSVIYQNRRAAR